MLHHQFRARHKPHTTGEMRIFQGVALTARAPLHHSFVASGRAARATGATQPRRKLLFGGAERLEHRAHCPLHRRHKTTIVDFSTKGVTALQCLSLCARRVMSQPFSRNNKSLSRFDADT